MSNGNSEMSKVEKTSSETFNATCIHCGESRNIQLWPHRNGHGNMIGFVFACSGCANIVRGVTMEIHGIRGHSDTPMTEEEWADCSSDMVSAALQMRDIARELERKKDEALVEAGQLMGENTVLRDEVAQLKMRIGCLESHLGGLGAAFPASGEKMPPDRESIEIAGLQGV